MSTNLNIFLDFSVIRKSVPEKLRDEFETLIQYKNQIYVWSKTISIDEMRRYCTSIKYPDLNEVAVHKKVKELRKEKKPFKEISDTLSVPMWKLSYYLTTNENKLWTLDDWIKNYYKKDSSIYQKADFIIDPDQKFVDKFRSAGVEGNCLEKIS
jgi:hypothetical protein